jgi:hypothetical protein
LIEALDQAGLSPKAAFWYYDPDLEGWRLAISLPIVDQIEGLKGYEKVGLVARKIKPPLEIRPEDIDLYGSNSALLKVVRKAIRPKRKAVETFKQFHDQVDYRRIEDAYIYRLQ